ncbi:hypothetical protein [Ilumatobacter coccineus]|uniref:Uncharacterized protein n=1 Tax=Ilumatobacter coccineus (strain NBRC 103263 / KCTC 29153 / YM16-304) TaxID=1313172 RepID=A0A6C7EDJ7_ILUCY|nr:hypothetical protein [Ilumatobacter coccineus]BAN03259.1 hypothetical protein YM304_29450 [Ilumatobacter coccineus YM16-304]
MELAARDDIPSDHDALSDVLAQLGERVAPVTFARERTLPIAEPLSGLFPEQALVRGRVLSCCGTAASSMAFSVASEALAQGAWMAVVDVDTFGADAAAELGVPLERIVRIESNPRLSSDASAEAASDRLAAEWIDVMGAAVDGFDIVVTRVPASLRTDRRPAAVRKLGSRVQQRGAVVLVLGDAGALGSDITLTTQRTVWEGLGQGFGHLRCRQIEIEAAGRRQPRAQRCSLELVGAAGRVALRAGVASGESALAVVAGDDLAVGRAVDAVELDPQAEVLAEMRAGLHDDHLAAG